MACPSEAAHTEKKTKRVCGAPRLNNQPSKGRWRPASCARVKRRPPCPRMQYRSPPSTPRQTHAPLTPAVLLAVLRRALHTQPLHSLLRSRRRSLAASCCHRGPRRLGRAPPHPCTWSVAGAWREWCAFSSAPRPLRLWPSARRSIGSHRHPAVIASEPREYEGPRPPGSCGPLAAWSAGAGARGKGFQRGWATNPRCVLALPLWNAHWEKLSVKSCLCDRHQCAADSRAPRAGVPQAAA